MPEINLLGSCEYTLRRGGLPAPCGKEAREKLGNQMLCRKHRQTQMLALAQQIQDDPAMRTWARGALGAAGAMARYSELTRDRQAWISNLEQIAKKEQIVYFVERDGFLKIGITIDVEKRVKEISRGSAMIAGMTIGPVILLATMPGGRKQERALHKKFRQHHVDGEWFLFDDEIRQYVANLPSNTASDLQAAI